MLIVYFGADAGSGCTMLTQSTANYVAALYSNKRILMLSLSGDTGIEYAKQGFNYSIDDLQVKLKSDVLTLEELESLCIIKKNLYILAGSGNLKQRKEYMPEDIMRLVKLAESQFDYIIADAGCSIDLGLGLGALKSGGRNILVVTQSQRGFTRYSQKESILKTLGISFSGLIVNKYVSRHFLVSEKVVRDSYKFEKCSVIEYSDYGMQAEEEGTALEGLDKSYKKQIDELMSNLFGTSSSKSTPGTAVYHDKRKLLNSLKFFGGKRGV